jgi:dTDP-4-dehydrorhamnose reductase
MKRHKIIIIGARGMLGSVVSKYLATRGENIMALTRKELDIEEKNSIFELEEMIKPDTDYIINCAGIIKPRIGEDSQSAEETMEINSGFPIKLAALISVLNKRDYPVKFIHVSTDCVFTGNNEGKYQIDDTPDAKDVYGLSKFLGECCKIHSLVIRTSIIGEELKNKYSLLEWMKSMKGGHVHGWDDHIWNGVTTLQLAKFIEEIIENDQFQKGLIQYAGEPINKYDLLCAINKIYNLEIDVHRDQGGNVCDRSLELNLRGITHKKIPHIKEQLAELKQFFEQNM